MKNINEIFDKKENLNKNKPLFWFKQDLDWVSISWSEASNEKKKLIQILKSLKIKKGDKVSIIAQNSPRWCIADLSIMSLGGITVPGYITSNEDELLYLLNHSESKIAFVSSDILSKIEKVFKKLLYLKHIICVDGLKKKFKKFNVVNYEDLLKKFDLEKIVLSNKFQKVDKNDLACIIYTSGTSARPKGVMLTHGSIIENIKGAKQFVDEIEGANHKFVSILPLSHAYEHTGGFLLPILIGGEIYFSNNREQLLSDLQFAKPTLMVAVPRLYDVLYKRILNNIKSKGIITKSLFFKTLKIGKKKYKKEKLSLLNKILDSFLDQIIRKKIKQIFGGNLIAFISGGAALNFNSGIFFTSLGIKILQGYGQTECSPIISVNPINKIKLSTVGIPIKNHDVKLSKSGEILVKGPSLMKGYWKDKKSTNKTIKNGWLHTGDLGKIDEDKYISIVGRKNEMIVNTGGENISPVPLEELLTSYEDIEQVMIYGHGKPYLVALIHSSLNKKDIKNIIGEINSKLSIEKKIRNFYSIDKPFTIETLELTPTLKMKRKVIEKKYEKQIRAMYK